MWRVKWLKYCIVVEMRAVGDKPIHMPFQELSFMFKKNAIINGNENMF